MKRVLVTGSDGFIGRNICARLAYRDDIEVLRFDVGNSDEELAASIRSTDFVIHLAGVNRPKEIKEYDSGNRGLTKLVIEMLSSKEKKVPILISSTIQAVLDNPYGKSKLDAETVIRNYAEAYGVDAYLFRLPNVFGKWCRPNYNSVIATWCYNSTRGIPIQINDLNTELDLVYIDDVSDAFISALDGGFTIGPDGFCRIERVYRRRLGHISSILLEFVESRKSFAIPSFDDAFVQRLYATWLSYIPEDGFDYPLAIKKDSRGWLAEFVKSSSFGQVFVSKTRPGITRGNHWHHTKVEKFLVVQGKALICFRRIGDTAILEYPVSGDEARVVDIPVGYTHSITNVGDDDLITLFWADEVFNPGEPDTYFQEV